MLVASNVRVNHTDPSKSGRPLVSQLPGTCMSFQLAAISVVAGARQSGRTLVGSRSATGRLENGGAGCLSSRAASVNPSTWRIAAT